MKHFFPFLFLLYITLLLMKAFGLISLSFAFINGLFWIPAILIFLLIIISAAVIYHKKEKRRKRHQS